MTAPRSGPPWPCSTIEVFAKVCFGLQPPQETNIQKLVPLFLLRRISFGCLHSSSSYISLDHYINRLILLTSLKKELLELLIIFLKGANTSYRIRTDLMFCLKFVQPGYLINRFYTELQGNWQLAIFVSLNISRSWNDDQILRQKTIKNNFKTLNFSNLRGLQAKNGEFFSVLWNNQNVFLFQTIYALIIYLMLWVFCLFLSCCGFAVSLSTLWPVLDDKDDINRSFCVANAPCGHKLKRKRLRSGRIQQQPQQRRPFTATSCRTRCRRRCSLGIRYLFKCLGASHGALPFHWPFSCRSF